MATAVTGTRVNCWWSLGRDVHPALTNQAAVCPPPYPAAFALQAAAVECGAALEKKPPIGNHRFRKGTTPASAISTVSPTGQRQTSTRRTAGRKL